MPHSADAFNLIVENYLLPWLVSDDIEGCRFSHDLFVFLTSTVTMQGLFEKSFSQRYNIQK